MPRFILLAAAAAVAQPNDDASARIKTILSRVGSTGAAPDGAAAEDLRARLDRLRAGRLFDGVDAAAAPAEKAAASDDESVRLVTGNDRAEQVEADRVAVEELEAKRLAAERAEAERLEAERDALLGLCSHRPQPCRRRSWCLQGACCAGERDDALHGHCLLLQWHW